MDATGTNGYRIRRMERAELAFALDLAAAEGWNPGLADAGPFWDADPRGHFLGLLDGRPAATLCAVRYGPELAFIGLYIVMAPLRGRGLGMRLWQAALADMDARGTACAGLDAVPAQQEAYRRCGFVLARQSRRYEGRAGGAMPEGLSALAAAPEAELLAYDRRCFPAGREDFLRAWLSQPGHTGLALRRGGRLAGYGVVRPCRSGSKIGPLFADDDAAARTLLDGLGAAANPGPLYFDAPLSNPGAVRLAETRGMRAVFETGRMYRGPAPEYDLAREFGVTSFELG